MGGFVLRLRARQLAHAAGGRLDTSTMRHRFNLARSGRDLAVGGLGVLAVVYLVILGVILANGTVEDGITVSRSIVSLEIGVASLAGLALGAFLPASKRPRKAM